MLEHLSEWIQSPALCFGHGGTKMATDKVEIYG